MTDSDAELSDSEAQLRAAEIEAKAKRAKEAKEKASREEARTKAKSPTEEVWEPPKGGRVRRDSDYHYSGGRNTLDIPQLDDYANFAQYVSMVRMWSATTGLCLTKQGATLAMQIPKNSARYGVSLHEDMITKITAEKLINNEEGVELILQFLQSRVGKDEKDLQIAAWRNLAKFERKKEQNISEFLTDFERRYEKCRSEGIEIIDTLSCYILLDAANLDTYEYKLIKAVLNLKKDKGNLYIKTKEKMREMLTDSIGDLGYKKTDRQCEVLATE